jgi:hypothetical protein
MKGLSVRIACGRSPELLALQPETDRESVLSPADRDAGRGAKKEHQT